MGKKQELNKMPSLAHPARRALRAPGFGWKAPLFHGNGDGSCGQGGVGGYALLAL